MRTYNRDGRARNLARRLTKDYGKLQGRIALVTGASQGIGRACALELARAGATVALAARNEAKLAEVVAEIEAAGGQAAAFALDMASEESIKAGAKAVLERFGKVEILVNNAGITRDGLMMAMKRADWDDVLATNLTGAFLLTQALLRPMLKNRWGRIINISSVVGRTGQAGQVNYARQQGGADRVYAVAGARGGFAGDHSECRGARLHRDAHDRGAGREAARGDDGRRFRWTAPGTDAEIAQPVAFLASEARGVHHRPRAGRERRNVHGRLILPRIKNFSVCARLADKRSGKVRMAHFDGNRTMP